MPKEEQLEVTHREAIPGKTPGVAEGPDDEHEAEVTACDPGKTPGSAEGVDGTYDDEPEETVLTLECPPSGGAGRGEP
ncbi:MAG: hypothetical protein IRZ16_20545 [Myxococcaceae bacterium]|nr:hypothetical protein [Myxococcaceae bacterium]